MISLPRIIASFAVFSLLSACGLKGPLYLPPPEPPAGQAPVQTTKKPPTAQTSPNAGQAAPQAPANQPSPPR